MKRSTLFGVAVLLIAAALLFAGCTDTGEAPAAGAITTRAPTAVANQPVQPVQPVQVAQPAQLQDPDAQFQSLVVESSEALNLTIPKIMDDMSKNDMAALQRDSATLSTQTSSFYTRIQALKVSPLYKDFQSNYLQILDDLRNAADFYVKGTGAVQAGDLDNGNKYLAQGNTYYAKVSQEMATFFGPA